MQDHNRPQGLIPIRKRKKKKILLSETYFITTDCTFAIKAPQYCKNGIN
jgi:hypothetical protein